MNNNNRFDFTDKNTEYTTAIPQTTLSIQNTKLNLLHHQKKFPNVPLKYLSPKR